MSVNQASFRLAFPAYQNAVRYPSEMVELWLSLATKTVNAERWGELTDLGVMLVTAHYLALEAQAVAQGNSNGTPGGSVGVLSSKSAQGVSASYDISASTEKDAGHWNLTTYGTRFYKLAKMMGAGGLQVGLPSAFVSVSAAWPGVIFE